MELNNLNSNYFVKKGFSKGRNISDGYFRGWGLQFGGLKAQILNDPLFNEAYNLLANRTIVTLEKIMNIFMILKYYLNDYKDGHIVEFGSYKGGLSIFMAYIVDKLYPGMKVYGLDTFNGMPYSNKEKDAHTKGDFSDVDYNELTEYVNKIGLNNLKFIKGDFRDTASGLLNDIKKVCLTYIDCDIFQSVSYAYNTVKKFMIPGGYILFDDAGVSSCLGAQEAVEENVIQNDGLYSEQTYPHYVFRAPGKKDQSDVDNRVAKGSQLSKRPGETSKAHDRRVSEDFFNKYCRGEGIDIGSGGDVLCDNCLGWDLDVGDAQYMDEFKNESFDFVYSSHLLEEIDNPDVALQNWWRLLRSGGYLILYLPERDLYEKKLNLPSNFNFAHKRFLLLDRDEKPDTIGVMPLIYRNITNFEVIYKKICNKGHTITDPNIHSDGEYSMEIVLRKK